MADYGIKITKTGQDVSSADLDDYVLHSGYSIMKTYLVGNVSYTFGSDLSSVDIEIAHTLGYHPVVYFSYSGPVANSDGYDLWAHYYNSGGNKALRFWIVESNTNNIRIHYGETNVEGSGYNPTGETWNFKYYVFIEELF